MSVENFTRFWCQKVLPLVYDDSISYYETLCKIADSLNKCIDQININMGDIENIKNDYVTKIDLEENRHLSPNGDFTGTIKGKKIDCIFTAIADAISLSKTLIDDINARVSIGGVYDGGSFTDTEPPTLTIDGGTFYDLQPILTYDVNCIRSDYKLRGEK